MSSGSSQPASPSISGSSLQIIQQMGPLGGGFVSSGGPPSRGSASTPTAGGVQMRSRKVSSDEVQRVQQLIEQCLLAYMTLHETVYALQENSRIDPAFTTLVWQKLEEQNPDFFKAYYQRLKVKQQIVLFNYYVGRQADLMKVRRPGVDLQAVPLLSAGGGGHAAMAGVGGPTEVYSSPMVMSEGPPPSGPSRKSSSSSSSSGPLSVGAPGAVVPMAGAYLVGHPAPGGGMYYGGASPSSYAAAMAMSGGGGGGMPLPNGCGGGPYMNPLGMAMMSGNPMAAAYAAASGQPLMEVSSAMMSSGRGCGGMEGTQFMGGYPMGYPGGMMPMNPHVAPSAGDGMEPSFPSPSASSGKKRGPSKSRGKKKWEAEAMIPGMTATAMTAGRVAPNPAVGPYGEDPARARRNSVSMYPFGEMTVETPPRGMGGPVGSMGSLTLPPPPPPNATPTTDQPAHSVFGDELFAAPDSVFGLDSNFKDDGAGSTGDFFL